MLSIHETSSDDIYGTRKQTRRNVTDVISNTHGANLGVQRKTHQTDHAEVTQTLGGAHQPERARRESASRPGKHRFRVYHYRRRGHPGRAEDGRVRIADGEEGRRRRRIVVGIVAGGGGTEAEFRGGGGGGGARPPERRRRRSIAATAAAASTDAVIVGRASPFRAAASTREEEIAEKEWVDEKCDVAATSVNVSAAIRPFVTATMMSFQIYTLYLCVSV